MENLLDQVNLFLASLGLKDHAKVECILPAKVIGSTDLSLTDVVSHIELHSHLKPLITEQNFVSYVFPQGELVFCLVNGKVNFELSSVVRAVA